MRSAAMHSEKSKTGTGSLRIIALGFLVRGPVGGMAWCDLHYLLGLAQLGHEVYFVEDSDDYPSCYDPGRSVTDTDPTYGLRFIDRIFQEVGLGRRWAYYDAHKSFWHGPCADRILKLCESSDILLNLAGVSHPVRPWMMEIPIRVFVDKDPVFTQIRHMDEPEAKNKASQHTAHFTFAENFRNREDLLPDDGLQWEETRHPIFLGAWPAAAGRPRGRFTTVMQWESYPPREYKGRRYGMKSDSFTSYIDLPQKTGTIFNLVVGSPSAPRDLLRRKGWILSDPLKVSRTPWTYRDFIRRSKGEFTVAKHGYAASRCGWFSERSASYLASGLPVVVQETGFSDWMETGAGVIPFNNVEEALAGIEEINSRYEFHCRAARIIAEEYFDSRKVLTRLIERAINLSVSSSSDETRIIGEAQNKSNKTSHLIVPKKKKR
jgi:hypothetical protein